MTTEKRKSPRGKETAGLTILSVNNLPAKPNITEESIIDISEGGIRATISNSLKQTFRNGTKIEMEIHLSEDKKNGQIAALGHVVWMRQRSTENPYIYYIGIQFSDLEEKTREKIRAFVEK